MILRLAAALFLTATVFALHAAPVQATRAAALRRAFEDPAARRTVFFVRGMSCRACTFLLDRHLNVAEGIYWSRFNYPLRSLVVYHDPGKFSVAAVEEFVAKTEKLGTLLVGSAPAAEFRYQGKGPVATWKGGNLSLEEAAGAITPFGKTIAQNQIEEGTEIWHQLAYEIAGEEVRRRVLTARAGAEGYAEGAADVDIPAVLAKEFYWPVELLPPSPAEAAVALFIREKVILGDETEVGRERFDTWLIGLWKELSLDFRGEALELSSD